MARRRSGHYFTACKPGASEASRIKVLAYTRASAREVLVSRGYTNITFTGKPKAAARTWDINYAAIERAKKLLGITWPIKFTIQYSEAHNGVCTTKFALKEHRITVKPNCTALEASRILWHELGHCAYNEAKYAKNNGDVNAARAECKSEKVRFAYRDRPTEIYARSKEIHNNDFRLTRPR